MTSFLTTITEAQRLQLAEMMLVATTSKDPQLSIFNKTKVPTSIQDFNTWCLKGATSISKNLPIVVPRKTKCGKQSHMGPMDALANLMASGANFDELVTKDLSKEDANAEISLSTETPCVQMLLKDLKTPNEEANVKCI